MAFRVAMGGEGDGFTFDLAFVRIILVANLTIPIAVLIATIYSPRRRRNSGSGVGAGSRSRRDYDPASLAAGSPTTTFRAILARCFPLRLRVISPAPSSWDFRRRDALICLDEIMRFLLISRCCHATALKFTSFFDMAFPGGF